jgi:pimeloyl-ACP methyl ester carboxylesterase
MEATMKQAITDDGVHLHYEEAGTGTPIVFVHEFGGNLRSWEPQMRWFSRRHRCVAFAARGYPPSDVPEDVAMYSQLRAVQDIVAVMDAAGSIARISSACRWAGSRRCTSGSNSRSARFR